jgi:DNA-binding MarR family transcriptional regulator
LARFIDRVMGAMERIDLGDAGIAQLSLLEMRMLMALADRGTPLSLAQLAGLAALSVGRSGQAAARLTGLRLTERVGGGRGPERTIALTRRGRRHLGRFDTARETAIEAFIASLGESERLRLEGAVHLLGRDLDRFSDGMLAA